MNVALPGGAHGPIFRHRSAVALCDALAYSANVEGWDVRHFEVANKPPTACIMGATFQDGTRFSIIIFNDYSWALGLANKEWKLRKGGATDVAAYVDGQFITSGKAEHLTNDIAVLNLTGAETYRALQKGQRLDLQTPYGRLNFALKGSGKAMYALLDCVKTLQPAPSTPAQSADRDFQMVPLAEATVVLTNLLNAAGIRGWHLRSPKEGDHAVSFGLAGGSIGFFRAARGRTATADDYAGYVLRKWSELCKGKFMSGKQSVPSVDGSVVRKIATTCHGDGGERDTATETTIVRQPNGFLMELTQVMAIDSSAMPHGSDKQDHEAIVNAAMRTRDTR